MASQLSTVQNLIRLDIRMRRACQEPNVQSVRRIIEQLGADDLIESAEIRQWVVSRASTNHLFIAKHVLKLGREIATRGHEPESLSILNSVIKIATAGDPEVLGTRDFDHMPELNAIILTPGLISTHPKTWGKRIIDLQSAALRGHQKAEWPSQKRFREDWNKRFGKEYDIPPSYEPEYDDSADVWYYKYGHVDRDMRGVLAKAVRTGLVEALEFPNAAVFQELAQMLFDFRWALGFCQVLSSLYDRAVAEAPLQDWHISESVIALIEPRSERLQATRNFRRLLRRAMKDRLGPKQQSMVLQCIRNHASNEYVRWNELADVEDWTLLDDNETAEIGAAREKDQIGDPYDPREWPRSTGALIPSQPRSNDFGERWPHAEDRELFEQVGHLDRPPHDASLEQFDQWIKPRIDALKTLMSRDAAYGDDWYGETIGWCGELLQSLKRWIYMRESIPDHLAIPSKTYIEYLDREAPWWRRCGTACTEKLGQPVPREHARDDPEPLGWSSNDPFFVSVVFLNELFATDDCRDMEALQDQMVENVINHWRTWPAFSQATVLAVLHCSHWAKMDSLRMLLVAVAKDERQVSVLERSLHHLLRMGSSEIPDILQRLWGRVDTISDPDKTAKLIGEVVGNAAIRYFGDQEDTLVIRELAEWYQRLRDEDTVVEQSGSEFIRGILWGAKEYLSNCSELISAQADAWLMLANWGVDLLLRDSREQRAQYRGLSTVTAVLEMPWPDDVRRRLFQELADLLVQGIRDGSFDAFWKIHYALRQELAQDESSDNAEPRARREIAPSDELLLRFCRASAQRVAEWQRSGESTRDLGYVNCLYGEDTSNLIQAVYAYARDRDYVRRELPPIVDVLASSGLTKLATELRLHIRRH